MKRYLLFGGSYYYPEGGWFDFIDSFEFVADAIAVAESKYSEQNSNSNVYWWHVIDITTGSKVASENSEEG